MSREDTMIELRSGAVVAVRTVAEPGAPLRGRRVGCQPRLRIDGRGRRAIADCIAEPGALIPGLVEHR